AHRRGPDSAFAHWVLKGIDDAVKRVWKAAQQSRRRRYEVWVYSDHGQVRSASYRGLTGRSLGEAVRDFWQEDQGAQEGREKSGAAPEHGTVREGSALS